MSDTSFDYIVIGGGTAGALLCNRLSADRNVRVLLIEDHDEVRAATRRMLEGWGCVIEDDASAHAAARDCDLILADQDLEDGTGGEAIELPPVGDFMDFAQLERQHVRAVLAAVDGNQSAAAKILGIGRNTLARKLREAGVPTED